MRVTRTLSQVFQTSVKISAKPWWLPYLLLLVPLVLSIPVVGEEDVQPIPRSLLQVKVPGHIL